METMEVSQNIGIPGTVGTKYMVLTEGNLGSLPEYRNSRNSWH